MVAVAHAKLNFTLELLGVRADGYHALRSVVVPVSLADGIRIDAADSYSLSVRGPTATAELRSLPAEANLITRAVRLMQRTCGVKDEVAVTVEKHIPAGGGLGGGSADAAATMLALSKMWRLDIPRAELAALGAEIGSDVPALVWGRTVLMEGRGEIVSPFPEPPPLKIALWTDPALKVSTAAVFARADGPDGGSRNASEQMRRAFESGDPEAVAAALVNDLAPAAEALHPEIASARRRLAGAGCRPVAMSGSGPSLFGFADSDRPPEGCRWVWPTPGAGR